MASNKVRRLRKSMSPIETLVWSRIRRRQLGVIVRRQHKVGRFFVDFYIPAARLAIELDGRLHFEKDESIRDTFIASNGIEVLRFTGAEVYGDLDRVISAISVAIEARRGT